MLFSRGSSSFYGISLPLRCAVQRVVIFRLCFLVIYRDEIIPCEGEKRRKKYLQRDLGSLPICIKNIYVPNEKERLYINIKSKRSLYLGTEWYPGVLKRILASLSRFFCETKVLVGWDMYWWRKIPPPLKCHLG